MNTSFDAPGSASTENIETHPAGYIANSDFAFAYRAAGGKNFLRKFDLYETGNHFYIVGRDPRRNRVRLLTIERNPDEVRERQDVTLVKLSNDLSQYNGCKGVVIGGKPAQREWHVDFQPHDVANTRLHLWFKESNLSVNATMFKSEEIQPDKLELILENYRDMNSKLSFWKRHDGFSGLLGFAKFTDCKYLVGVTKKDVVARICGSEVFSVSSSIFLPFRNGSDEPTVTEQRYRSLFKSIDITRGFYFSYDYDLSRSLQSNMGGKPQPQRSQSSLADHGISQTFDKKFVWNFHLLRDVPAEHHCWAVYLMHGYVEQHRLSIGFNRVISLALLARRSCHFAGTRYRKRGISMLGHCANEVETEQIIIDESQGSSSGGHFFTSFVQLRASIPLFWSQPTELNFKPDVVLHSFDPLFHVTSIHFSHLLKRYGSPIHVINLIKASEETKPRESLLNDEFEKAIRLLNAGICDAQHAIGYTHFDFHYKHKRDSVGVFDELRKETEAVVNRTGIFHSGTNRWASSHPLDAPVAMCMQQQGVLRSNCIDCLDRTNVAQFYAGVKAMSLQLQALGISNTPVPMESDLPRLLMDLYSRMGNELALQYVGSVAHDKMGGTGKTTSFGLRALSKLVVSAQRYISNTFTDIEKQQAIDVFLGTFIPRPDPWTPIWAADDLSFCWNDKTNPQYAQLRRNRPPDNWWREPIAMFHSGYCMGLNTADARPMESLAAPEFLRGSSHDERRRLRLSDAGGDVSSNCSDAGVAHADRRDINAQSHKCTRTFRMMLTGIDANFDRTHAKGKYVTFEPLLDQKDPAQEKRFSTVDDGDDNTTLIFADEFSMLNRECGKPQVCARFLSGIFCITHVLSQRLQAFPTTDSSVLSLMTNLFTQRSLDRNEPPLCSDLFLKSSTRDWRLETTISSAAQHGVLKPPTYNDTHSISEHANASLKQVERCVIGVFLFYSCILNASSHSARHVSASRIRHD